MFLLPRPIKAQGGKKWGGKQVGKSLQMTWGLGGGIRRMFPTGIERTWIDYLTLETSLRESKLLTSVKPEECEAIHRDVW